MNKYFDEDLIEATYPEAQCIPAMKIWKLPQGKENMYEQMCDNGEYFGEIKKDGYWYEFEKTQNYTYLFGKTTSKVTGLLTEKSANVPHIIEALSALPADTILIGEIYYPNGTSKTVTTIMGCLADKAVQRQNEKGLIHYYIHDIIRLNGEDLINSGALKRYNILKQVFQEYNLTQYPFLELADIILDNIAEETVNALNRGEEGIVLKKKDYPYTPEKRPAWSTIKMKQHDTADVVCMGFCDATKEYTGKELDTWEYWIDGEAVTKGYYFGWKTAIRIGAYNSNGILKEIGTIASGLTDELRADFAACADKYLNKVCRVDCMSLDSKEKTIRHGIFKGFRDDKDAADCLLEDIFK